jgi:hypothetical protein
MEVMLFKFQNIDFNCELCLGSDEPVNRYWCFSSSPRPGRLWGPHSLLSKGNRGSITEGKADHSAPYSGEECVELYLHSPIRLQGVCLIRHRYKFTFTREWVVGAKHCSLDLPPREEGPSKWHQRVKHFDAILMNCEWIYLWFVWQCYQ